MRVPWSTLARSRVSDAPVPSSRVGLSVFLKKPLPDARAVPRGAAPRLRAEGAILGRATLAGLPPTLSALLTQRVAADTPLALHVLRHAAVATLDVPSGVTRDVTLHDVVTRGAFTTLSVRVGRGATLRVRERLAPSLSPRLPSRSSRSYASTLVLLDIREGARVTWYGGVVGFEGPRVVERLAVVEKDARLEEHSALLNCDVARERVHAVLSGAGASALVRSVFLGRGAQQVDLAVSAAHEARATTSDLRAKGVLGGAAQAVYRGLIRVDRAAPGSDGNQRVDALLLSRAAEVDAVPNLEINTDDVRCTHGATAGHVNPDHLFYLRSRGLSEERATALIVSGFLAETLASYPLAMEGALAEAVSGISLMPSRA